MGVAESPGGDCSAAPGGIPWGLETRHPTSCPAALLRPCRRLGRGLVGSGLPAKSSWGSPAAAAWERPRALCHGQAGPTSRAGRRSTPLLAAAAWIPSVEERVMVLACSAKCYHISSNFHFLWAGFQLSIFLPDARISQTFRSLRRSSVNQMRRRCAFRHPCQLGRGGGSVRILSERRSRARRHSHVSGQ